MWLRLLTLTAIVTINGRTHGADPARKPFCKWQLNKYYNEHLGCHDCDKCPEGEQHHVNLSTINIDPLHGALSCFGCEKCPKGTYSLGWSHSRCNRCLTCGDLNRETNVTCTATRNARCGKCRTGYHDKYKFLGIQDYTNRPCQLCKFALNAPECQTSPSPRDRLEKQTASSIQPKFTDTHSGTELGTFLVPVAVIALVVFLTVVAIWKLRHKIRPCRTASEGEFGMSPIYDSSHTCIYMRTCNTCGSEHSSYDSLLPKDTTGAPLPAMTEPPLPPATRPVTSLVPGVADARPPSPRETTTALGNLPSLVETDAEPDYSDDEVTDSDVRLIQNEISKRWKDLGRALLIKESDIEKVEIENPNNTNEQIFQILSIWKKNESRRPIWKLCDALNIISRNDVTKTLIDLHRHSYR